MDGDLAGLKQDVACLSSEQREGQDKILAAVNDSTFSLHGRVDEIDDQDKGLASILAGITDLFMGTEKKMEMKNEDVRAKLKDSGAEVATLKERKRKLMVQVDKETEKKNDLRSKLEEEEKEYERLKIDLAHAERKLRHWDRPTECKLNAKIRELELKLEEEKLQHRELESQLEEENLQCRNVESQLEKKELENLLLRKRVREALDHKLP
jgi:chromosome segregation ATPase